MISIGYARVSVSTGNGDSLDAQAEAIADWCAREGHELLAVHDDDGRSGTLDHHERGGLAAALADLEVPDGDDGRILVVHRLDRLARELHVQEAILAKAW